jgi:hypothetical protein
MLIFDSQRRYQNKSEFYCEPTKRIMYINRYNYVDNEAQRSTCVAEPAINYVLRLNPKIHTGPYKLWTFL